jgi:hypothetical protein
MELKRMDHGYEDENFLLGVVVEIFASMGRF